MKTQDKKEFKNIIEFPINKQPKNLLPFKQNALISIIPRFKSANEPPDEPA